MATRAGNAAGLRGKWLRLTTFRVSVLRFEPALRLGDHTFRESHERFDERPRGDRHGASVSTIRGAAGSAIFCASMAASG